MTDNERQFVIELEALTRKYRIKIESVCDEHPWIESIGEHELSKNAGYCIDDGKCLVWVSESDQYYWRNLSHLIVKDQNA